MSMETIDIDNGNKAIARNKMAIGLSVIVNTGGKLTKLTFYSTRKLDEKETLRFIFMIVTDMTAHF